MRLRSVPRAEVIAWVMGVLAVAFTAAAIADGAGRRTLVLFGLLGAGLLFFVAVYGAGGRRVGGTVGGVVLGVVATIAFLRSDIGSPTGGDGGSASPDLSTTPSATPSPVASTRPSTTRPATSAPPTPSSTTPSVPTEETTIHTIRINVVKSLYGGALLVRPGYTDEDEAQIRYTTANASCLETRHLAEPVLIVGDRAGWWYDVTLTQIVDRRSITIRVVRGRGEPPKRYSVCGD